MAGLKEILAKQAALPARIEQALPAAAPKISTIMRDIAASLPVDPILPVNPLAPNDDPPVAVMDIIKGIDDIIPAFPAIGTGTTLARASGNRAITVTQPNPITQERIPSPSVGIIPEVITRRGM